MKKVTYLILFMVSLWTQVARSQAFDDIKRITGLISSGNSTKKIAEIILPYFTRNGVLQRQQMEVALAGELGDIVKAYLAERAQNIDFLKKYSEKPDGAAVNGYLKKIKTLVGEMNSGITDPKFTVLQISKGFTMEDIVSYKIKPETENLLLLLKHVKNLPDSASIKITDSIKNNLDANAFAAVDEVVAKLELLKNKSAEVVKLKDQMYAEIASDRKFDKFLDSAVKNPERRALVTDGLKGLNLSEKQNVATAETAALSGSFSLPTQSEALDALVILVAKRFSQEVAITFMETLRKRARDMRLVTDIFPKTTKLLMEGNAYEIPKLGSAWHQSIAQDIYDLPMNLKSSKYLEEKMVGGNTPNFLLFQDVVTIGELARGGNSLPEIVTLYKTGLYGKLNNEALRTGFEFINLIDHELSSSSPDQGKKFWIDWSKLNNLDNRQWNFFFQLISERYKEDLLKKVGLDAGKLSDEKWQYFRNTLMRALVLLNQFQDKKIAALQEGGSVKVKVMSFWECQQQLFGILLNEQLFPLPASVQTRAMVGFANRGLQIYRLQEDGNYPAMLRESILMVRELLPMQTARLDELMVKNWKLSKDKFAGIARDVNIKLEPLNGLYAKLSTIDTNKISKAELHQIFIDFGTVNGVKFSSTGNTESMLKEMAQQYNSSLRDLGNGLGKHVMYVNSSTAIINIFNNAMSSAGNRTFAAPQSSGRNMTVVLTTAEFFTDVMAAGNSKQLSQVIESYAMPPNSYKIKRNTRYSIDLDAYVGLYGGVEYLGSKTPDSVKSFAPVWGLSAPIGISFSWGSRRDTKVGEPASFLDKSGNPKTLSGNNFSITVSLLDIATPLAFRLSNDSQEALPKSLSWSQLFSPGLHFRWGIRNTPLCFSTGLQYTPQLRKMDLRASDQQAYRAYAGVFFDLPLFNIYKRN